MRVFSPMALAGAGLLALSGVGTAALYLHAVADLWSTAYGRALPLKLLLSGGVAVVGYLHWQRVRPRLSEAAGAARLRRTARLELALAAAVLAVTAVLVGLPQPGE